jgi:hypothetical protein
LQRQGDIKFELISFSKHILHTFIGSAFADMKEKYNMKKKTKTKTKKINPVCLFRCPT